MPHSEQMSSNINYFLDEKKCPPILRTKEDRVESASVSLHGAWMKSFREWLEPMDATAEGITALFFGCGYASAISVE